MTETVWPTKMKTFTTLSFAENLPTATSYHFFTPGTSYALSKKFHSTQYNISSTEGTSYRPLYEFIIVITIYFTTEFLKLLLYHHQQQEQHQ